MAGSLQLGQCPSSMGNDQATETPWWMGPGFSVDSWHDLEHSGQSLHLWVLLGDSTPSELYAKHSR